MQHAPRTSIGALCCLLLFGCPGQQPCIGNNDAWLRIPQSRIAQIAEITSEGVCTVGSSPASCDAGGCLKASDGGVTAHFVVTGTAPGTCTVTVTYSDGSPPEDAQFSFVNGPIQYCCEAVCAKTAGALQPRN